MKVIVSIDHRFIRTRNGRIYSSGNCDQIFWGRYLQVFDEVVVFARVLDVDKEAMDKTTADGEKVQFAPAPYYIGPWQYLKHRRTINSIASQLSQMSGCFILRSPTILSTVLWNHLRKKNKPYGVEVVADPWDSFSPGSVASIVRPYVRRKFRSDLRKQCENAAAVSYVTEYMLQKRYPPGGWSTHYSSISLPADSIVDKTFIERRVQRWRKKKTENVPFQMCYIGTLSQLYKGPDILLSAFAECRSRGLDIKLNLVGEGQYKEQLERQSVQLGIQKHVCFTGRLPAGSAIYEQLDHADLYVLPSRQEGLPRTIIEAIARAAPVISTTVGGIPELLAQEDMVRPNSSKELADKIFEVLNSERRITQMSERNLQKAGQYSQEVLNERRLNFYNELIRKSV